MRGQICGEQTKTHSHYLQINKHEAELQNTQKKSVSKTNKLAWLKRIGDISSYTPLKHQYNP